MGLEREPLAAPDPGANSRPRLEAALARGRDRLLELQQADGSWVGELESNASITAEYLLLQRYLGRSQPERERQVVRYLLGEQGPDGGWAIAPGLEGDLSVTAETWVALRVAGLPASHAAVARARDFVEAHGGLRATRLFTRMWLALGGLWDWDELPTVPPEWLLLPGSGAGSIYDLASWARATTVPLTILRSQRTVFGLEGLSREELPLGPPRAGAGTIGWRVVERALRGYGHLPPIGLRAYALNRAERWIVDHQEQDGSWAGIQPPWVYGLMALRARGYSLEHPVVRRGLEALESFGIEDDRGFRLQACVSPVWDTALALWALVEAGVPASDPALRRAVGWLLAREVTKPGDWAVRRPRGQLGGWPFEYFNDQYPDMDDTAVVLSALRLAGHRRDDPGEVGDAIRRALGWLLAMQGRDGGYGAFDVDNRRAWVEHLPIADFGEMLDRASPDVTAHVVEAYSRLGGADLEPARRRALDWLRRAEQYGGAYYGRWGVNYVYGNQAVAAALVVGGQREDRPRLARLGDWVAGHQHPSGGFGESVLSYHSEEHVGRGEPTPSQTAWALLALQGADQGAPELEREGSWQEASSRAVAWLLEHQETGGGWTDQQYTGTGFPRAFYLCYRLYATTFPVMALARACRPELAGPAAP
ncbi:MAG: squalene--hopene cyclase [Candidatus Dormibacteria bacterium]